MDQKALVKLCRELGCCDLCCLRYLGVRNPSAYGNPQKYLLKFEDVASESPPDEEPPEPSEPMEQTTEKNECEGSNSERGEGPAAKRRRVGVCCSCLGVLQEGEWAEACRLAGEELGRKGYMCKTFACALSAPMATILREKVLTLRLKEAFPKYEPDTLTALKEAWKWSFGPRLASHVGLTLDSGAVAPLLVTIHIEYPMDEQELEVITKLQPNRRRGPQTRRSVQLALEGGSLGGQGGVLGEAAGTPQCPAKAQRVETRHEPGYLAGRYVKLSRELPQTPWLLNGKRMMDSSVQDIIFGPLAEAMGIPPSEAGGRLKLVCAGREDVDVRCLGDGRPFAVEVSDPPFPLSEAQLAHACTLINADGRVRVRRLTHVTREDLTLLKKGEETKCKTYEALCIKLEHSEQDKLEFGDAPVRVTASDLSRVNEYRNTPIDSSVRVRLEQLTPLRVLHRRPRLSRVRGLLELSAREVPGHPQLLVVSLQTEAGTYVKEWVHGELRRTRPSLQDALGAKADILALDVTGVHLAWPPGEKTEEKEKVEKTTEEIQKVTPEEIQDRMQETVEEKNKT